MKDVMNVNRRDFLKGSALGVLGTGMLGTMAVPAIITGCTSTGGEKLKDVVVPELLTKAPDGRALKAGLIGCGGRGTGAVLDFLKAGDGLQVTAIGDVFGDKVNACRNTLREYGVEFSDDQCFSGFDAYKQVIDSGVDIVLHCSPPTFRPVQFEYAVEKGKHCFIEKPCGVDPVGVRSVIATARRASAQGLSVISGTIRRSQRNCVETYRRVAGGAIGDIVSAHVTRQGNASWFVRRRPEWSDMEYMLRNWINFCWTAGDLLLEQFIHEIDQMNWFLGDIRPEHAEANGGRHRRTSGDMFDFFSVEYVYENGMRTHCTSRQINGCDNLNRVFVYGTKGYTNCFDTIWNLDGSEAWKYPYVENETTATHQADAYVQEHIRLVSAIRKNEPVNDAEIHAQSIFIALMGRMSAYSGKFVTFDEVFTSPLKLGPDSHEFGPVPSVTEGGPVPGIPTIPLE